MDSINTSVSEILESIRNEQISTLSDILQIEPEFLAVAIEENPLLEEIFKDIALKNTEIAQHLSEINEQLNK